MPSPISVFIGYGVRLGSTHAPHVVDRQPSGVTTAATPTSFRRWTLMVLPSKGRIGWRSATLFGLNSINRYVKVVTR
jgi:hypothetical protein